MSQSKMGSVNSPPTIEEKMEGLKGNVYPERLVGNETEQTFRDLLTVKTHL